MTDSSGTRSSLPLIIILLTAAVCLIAGLSIGGVALLSARARTSVPAIDVAFPARETGSASAKVVVEEFGDFQCPYCAMFNTTAEIALREKYFKTGKARFIFRNFPVVDSFIAGGNESRQAALAALCAGDQDMFWEYHDLLFQSQSGENQGGFSIPRLEALAAQLHLDGVKFDRCLSNQTHADILNGDIRLANKYKINGTPTFFVNGRQISVSQDFHELFTAIDQALSQ